MDIILQFFKENLMRPIILDVVQTPQILASIQFAFTSILTFFIPLLVILFEKRDEFNSLDKKLIEKISKIRFILVAIIAFIITSILLSEITWLSVISYFIIFSFLGFQTLAIINFILNRDKYRQREILKSNNEEALDYFEEFFLGGNGKSSAGITTRNYQKVFSKEQLMVNIFNQNLSKKFEHYNKLSTADLIFVTDMLKTLELGLAGIDHLNIISNKENTIFGNSKNTLFYNLFKWHFKAWKKNKIDTTESTNDATDEKSNSSYSLSVLLFNLIKDIIEPHLNFQDSFYNQITEQKYKYLASLSQETLLKYPDYINIVSSLGETNSV